MDDLNDVLPYRTRIDNNKLIIIYHVLRMDFVAVFTLFVFTLSLLCFRVLPFSSVNKDLYNT